jgi:D-alanyl-D-alanine endopeptidase (penicillin-binding protein 7)
MTRGNRSCMIAPADGAPQAHVATTKTNERSRLLPRTPPPMAATNTGSTIAPHVPSRALQADRPVPVAIAPGSLRQSLHSALPVTSRFAARALRSPGARRLPQGAARSGTRDATAGPARIDMSSCRRVGYALLAQCLVLFLTTTQVAAAAVATPEVKSQAYYILDGSDSSVLASRRENTAAPIASITKLMTALVVLEAGQSMDELLTISADDVRGTTGSGSRLFQGARLTRSDLLHLALMSSENRAAHALCRNYPQGLKACVRAMNQKAADLGMKSAHFVEPTGLSERNVASPCDLAKLVLAAGDDATIRAYSTDADHTVLIGRQALQFRNTNSLVDKADWDVSIQKTGYISEAGRCLVMQARIQGRPVVIVLLNSFGKYTRIADAKRIRTWLEQQHRQVAAVG